MASMEPRASPSGPTWQASATDSASRSTPTARCSSSAMSLTQPVALGDVPEDVLHPVATAYTGIGLERQLRCPLQTGLAGNGRLEPGAVLGQRLGHRVLE